MTTTRAFKLNRCGLYYVSTGQNVIYIYICLEKIAWSADEWTAAGKSEWVGRPAEGFLQQPIQCLVRGKVGGSLRGINNQSII